jgi:hypothetical protein
MEKGLRDGWLASVRACSLPARPPLHVAIWRRGKWWIIAGGLLLLEVLVLGTLGETMGTHF